MLDMHSTRSEKDATPLTEAERNLSYELHASKSRASRLLAAHANRLRIQGCYREAEPLFRQAVALAEEAFGPNHLEVAAILNNLAVLFKYTGRFEEAESLYGRALAIIQESLGANHPDVAAIYHNLGGLDMPGVATPPGNRSRGNLLKSGKRRSVLIMWMWLRTSPR